MANNEPKKSLFDRISDDIHKQSDNGNIIVPTSVGPMMFKLEEFIKQPTEGILYDLGLDEGELSVIYKDEPLRFTQMMAINNTIKKLKSKLEENGNGE